MSHFSGNHHRRYLLRSPFIDEEREDHCQRWNTAGQLAGWLLGPQVQPLGWLQLMMVKEGCMDFGGCDGATQNTYLGADGVLGYKRLAWDSKAQECQELL